MRQWRSELYAALAGTVLVAAVAVVCPSSNHRREIRALRRFD